MHHPISFYSDIYIYIDRTSVKTKFGSSQDQCAKDNSCLVT